MPRILEEDQDGNIKNRKQRRDSRFGNNSLLPQTRRLIFAHDGYHEHARLRDELVRKIPSRQVYSQGIYHGDGVLLGYLDAARSLPVAKQRAPQEKLTAAFIKHFPDDDIYSVNVNGLSLFELEEMGGDLVPAQIQQINRMLRHNKLLLQSDPRSILAAEQVAVAATHPLARPDIPFPKELMPLHTASAAYLDFYLPYVTDRSLNKFDEIDFMNTAVWVGVRLIRAIGSYIPACLGISPSSAIKLYQEKQPFLLCRASWKKIADILTEEAGFAYHPTFLPQPIERFQHYIEANERTVADTLTKHYQTLPSTGVELGNTEEILEQLSEAGKYLTSIIRRTGENYLSVLLQEHPIFEEIKVAQRNQTIMFIAMLRGGKNHLLLEVNQRRQIFGISPKLQSEIPHARELLAGELISPVVDEISRRHPALNRELAASLSKTVRGFELGGNARTANQTTKRTSEPSSVPVLIKLARGLMGHEPTLPPKAEPVDPKFIVLYDKGLVRRLAGDILDKELDQILQGIRQFEYGDLDLPVKKEGTRAYYEIPAGNRIVTLKHIGEGEFMLTQVKPLQKEVETPKAAQTEINPEDLFLVAHPLRGHMDPEQSLSEFLAKFYPKSLEKYGDDMFKDVVMMLQSLRLQPKGKGSYPVQKQKAKIDREGSIPTGVPSRTIRLRGFRGDQRGLDFRHPEAHRVRIAYYLHPTEERMIVFQDILHHNEWDEKYAINPGS